ncbi:Hypothetical predicted protein [Cloeon dipterum]|uniref:Uncharacterized protein n=1 Tax=Cloeon dipterum TaxID=197152 RepID=A0A8S1E0J7_9INSE|nr:Hypothetical predicted protein [Cloeon dipterum]
MPTWLNYHTLNLPSGRSDVAYCGRTKNNQVIYVARTCRKGYCVPGYAVEGNGFFVSNERQPFQTDDFQVLVDANIRWVEYTENHELCVVAFDSISESNRFKIGSFDIEGERYCGMVDNENTCYINFGGEVRFKRVPEFKILIDLRTETEVPDDETTLLLK